MSVAERSVRVRMISRVARLHLYSTHLRVLRLCEDYIESLVGLRQRVRSDFDEGQRYVRQR